ncbi:hypothetical protein [Rubellicoccus peritrichatus]|uniref:Uncharacterized protein n=1 Tax=Rubellicoccus peritrichatus TaxID=3080537 RepID=A0AAQ3LFC4_9BACT|nr:hypothetical protein [Puniceicoccus sp. CR14]WOO42850.1 hypothetical protein RZN69_07075 [Puniceicoccus sp. CR14]
MTHDEAKAILQACRGDAAEASDPQVAEALEMAQEHPELADWQKNEMNFDQAFSESFSEVQPPEGLKERILASVEAPKVETESERTAIPFPPAERQWWQNPKLISMAASIVVIFTFGVLVMDPQGLMADPEVPQFYSDVAEATHTFPKMETRSDDLDHLREFLASKGAPRPGEMLPKVDPLAEIGALTSDWQGAPVSIVCMKGDSYYQLHIIAISVFGEDGMIPTSPNVEQHGEIAILFWADNDHLYVLSMKGSATDLAQML